MAKNLFTSDPENLLGNWKIKRSIIDYAGNQTGSFKGFAIISRTKVITFDSESNPGYGLFFLEKGTLKFGNAEFKSYREYKIFLNSDGGKIYFNDSKFFFSFSFVYKKQKVKYLCNSDKYNGSFRILKNLGFKIKWNVIGPKKNYYSNSIYIKEIN